MMIRKFTRLVISFNCFIEIEGVLKVTTSHVHCKCGNISELVQDKDVVTIAH